MPAARPRLPRRPRLGLWVVGGTVITAAGLAAFHSVEQPGGTGVAVAEPDPGGCGETLLKADGSTWTCTFVDDFDETTLDPGKWTVQETVKTGFRSEQTCFTATDRNVRVADGVLQLTAQDEGVPKSCTNAFDDFTTLYTGGMIGTKGKFSQTYGRFEVRAKYPATTASGLHGGFWMLPVDNKYGPWPRSGEIDVAEWWSTDPTLVPPSLHYRGRHYAADTGWECRISDVTGFHTYTVEWQPTGLDFFVDGSLCFSRTPEPEEPLVPPQPFDQPFSLILNFQVGMPTGTNKVTSATPFPATYEVDYVKAWR
jgi:beta-glucanase (GH16 family)